VRRALLPALAAAVLLLAGCNDSPVAPGQSSVQVDTPELRQLKHEAGVEPCRAGAGDSGALPAVKLACLGGGPSVDLATLQGPLVLNFWASNCAPCRSEMPALQAFHQKYGDRVPLIGIDYLDVLPGAALDLVKKTGVTYPLLADPGGDIQTTDIRPPGLPYFVFLAADGTVSEAAGGIDSAEQLVDLVKKNLGVTL
jgi:thiol-disulfide isomerase/thioredoxin